MISPYNNSYYQNCLSTKLDEYYDAFPTTSSPSGENRKIIDMAVQELDNIKKFLSNYE